jgi:hypothetical protein
MIGRTIYIGRRTLRMLKDLAAQNLENKESAFRYLSIVSPVIPGKNRFSGYPAMGGIILAIHRFIIQHHEGNVENPVSVL